MEKSLLQVIELCKDFDGRRVVDQANMAIARGEIRGIVGESGSGKSTLARCSLMLLKPSAGTVYFDGQNLLQLGASELRSRRREFQMVFQDPYASLNPRMVIEDIILEPLRIHSIGTPESRLERLRELSEAVSLDKAWMKRLPSELSGGQQQRVGIARALALRPRMLIADEPVSALDVSVQAQILNLLSDLKSKYDLTLILISHSLYVINYLCTQVSVMYGGCIVEESPVDRFFSGPRHPYSRLLLEAMPVLNSSSANGMLRSKMERTSSGGSERGCAFQANCAKRRKECEKQRPRLKEMAPSERVACILYAGTEE
jgi:oligopeptide transport system ATP-binding protein